MEKEKSIKYTKLFMTLGMAVGLILGSCLGFFVFRDKIGLTISICMLTFLFVGMLIGRQIDIREGHSSSMVSQHENESDSE